MTPLELYDSFMTFVEKDDEPGGRAFLIQHLNEFPQKTKEEIAFAFFTEAAISTSNEVAPMAGMQGKGKLSMGKMTKILNDMRKSEI